MKKQPILGYFREKNNTEEFKFKSESYKQAYHELFELLAERGIYIAILMGESTYLGGGKFSKHWVQVKKDDEFVFEKRGEIQTDLIWVKDKFEATDFPQINSAEFRKICSDKHLSYELLAEFQPKSFLVKNERELNDFLAKIPTEKVAIKTLSGNSGIGVFVGEKNDFDFKEFGEEFPLQIQEFVETDGGVPGIVEGRHDFRAILMNGEPILATLRTPPKDGLKSNIGYGGTTFLLEKSKIPQDLIGLCQKIDEKLSKISEDRFYSADFGLTENGWRLFEVNAMPGTINRDRGEIAIEYQRDLANFLTHTTVKNSSRSKTIGRAERINLLSHEILDIPAKIDTGAYSSSIDCLKAEIVENNGVRKLKFVLFNEKSPYFSGEEIITENFEETEVKNSNGIEKRFVIFEEIELAGQIFRSRLTLANRKHLRYPILIGRRLLRETDILVDVKTGQGLPDDEEERGL